MSYVEEGHGGIQKAQQRKEEERERRRVEGDHCRCR